MSDRDEFEATYKSVFPGHHLDRDINGDYVNIAASAAWRVYQADRAKSGQGVEPVAWATKRANGSLITASTDRNAELEWSENYVGATVIPLYTYPQPARQGSVPHWKELEALADEYVEGYEFRGDEGDYQPNERERFLIEDCVAGLMDEVHQMLKRNAPQPKGDERIPDWLFDGYAVYQNLSEDAKKRTFAPQVSDTLDAIVTMLKRPQPPAGQEAHDDKH